MGLTKFQQEAVYDGGHNIIVSAGAGSGKTKVLTERVFKHVREDKWDIDRMLVLTFTNAAAAEMKKRIRERLYKDETLETVEKQRQLNKIDSSYISTFDAYALTLVQKYHYILGLDKNISIIDSNILNSKKKELLDEIVKELYRVKDKRYLDLVNKFCVKNDDNIKEAILKIDERLSLIYDRSDYVKGYEEAHLSKKSIGEELVKYTAFINALIESLNAKVNEISEYIDYQSTFEGIDNLLRSSTYKDIRENSQVKINNLKKGSGEEATKLKKEITEIIKKIGEYTSFSEEDIIRQLENTKDDSLILLEVAERLNTRVEEFKRENDSFDFIDIFKMAIKLVDENEDIRDEIKRYFKEILIDEYQDTSDLQDEFIKRIENNNVYMVGDIKQSIYRFRNANPDLFRSKFNSYINGDGGKAIVLPDNFRSREEVLDNINTVFNRLMSDDIGGAEYTKGHQMIPGNKQYDLNKKDNQNMNMDILSYIHDKNEYPFNGGFKKEEVEAFIIAKDIKDKIDGGYEVTYFENDEMKLRKARYSDFAVLMDRGTDFDLYKQIFTTFNIPSNIIQDEKMEDSDLLTVIAAIFKLLTCLSIKDYGLDFKMAFISLARSFLVEAKDKVIYDAIKNNRIFETDLFKKINKIYDNISTKTISAIFDEIIEEFNVYQNLNKIGDVSDNMVKIDYLYQKAHELNNQGYSYLMFNDYLEHIFESEEGIRFNIQKDNIDAVTITNIHKSKGLEYGICYYSGLAREFNRMELNDNILFSKDEGIVISSFIDNCGLKSTIKKDIYKYRFDKEDIGEKIRLFYVALTRAKEKMIIVSPLEDKSTSFKISESEKLGIKSFNQMLSLIFDDLSDYIKDVDLNDYKFTKDYKTLNRNVFNSIIPVKEEIKIDPVFVKPVKVDESSFSKKAGLIDEDTKRKMELGTKVHYYLETLDFNNKNYDLVDAKYVDLIKAFFESKIMENHLSGEAYKEYEFIYEEDGQRKHGIIDLLMEYEDHLDIIDYKTKNIDDVNYDLQLNGYRRYIETITGKKTNCYLYSIVDKRYREVLK